jgi:intracellular sulfur oxidation DsrE/DsrF family protein
MKLTDSIKPILLVLLLSMTSFAQADEVKNKLVIQVSTDDPRTQKIALNNAVNLQKLYGMDNIVIEIVAYGPGLGLLTKKSGQASRVESLALQDIHFSACGNTMKKVARKSGKMPVLLEGVNQVTAGVARIMELQQQGYAYIRP